MDFPKVARALEARDAFDEYVRWRVVQHLLAGACAEMEGVKLPLPELAKAIDAAGQRIEKHLKLIEAMSTALARVLDEDAARGRGA